MGKWGGGGGWDRDVVGVDADVVVGYPGIVLGGSLCEVVSSTKKY